MLSVHGVLEAANELEAETEVVEVGLAEDESEPETLLDPSFCEFEPLELASLCEPELALELECESEWELAWELELAWSLDSALDWELDWELD